MHISPYSGHLPSQQSRYSVVPATTISSDSPGNQEQSTNTAKQINPQQPLSANHEANNNNPSQPAAGSKTDNNKEQDKDDSKKPVLSTAKIDSAISEAEVRQLRKLRARDREVRAHEQAHAAAAGSLAKGSPSYTYQRGPDGQLYAVGGEVQIDTSGVAGDPQATAERAQRIQRAALAPAQPSQQDRAIAANAAATEARARAEIVQEKINNERVEKMVDDSETTVGEEDDKQIESTESTGAHSSVGEEQINHAYTAADVSNNANEQAGNLLNITV